MKRKEIIKFIKENSPISIEDIFRFLNLTTHSEKKRLNRLLSSILKSRELLFDKEKKLFYVKGAEQKKIKVETRKRKVNNRINKRKINPVDDFFIVTDRFKIRRDFPENVLKEAESLSFKLDRTNRFDLRDKMIFTMDGSDAKDLDDAVSIEREGGGWQLGVHIADVSYYVKKNSKLDREAKKRGNSFYFINRVVPMFPFVLSNQLCSLNPLEDKLTLSIILNIDKTGDVKRYVIMPTIIRSRYRLTYDYVQSYFDGKLEISDKELATSLDEMRILYKILYEKRVKEGSIDFDFKEQKIELDENDEPVKVLLKERLDSERVIEEFMLIANKCIAKFLSEKDISLYRIHEEPEENKLKGFLRIALKFGHKVEGSPMPTPFDIQKVLKEVKDKPHKELINYILLRSMQQARYHVENFGHYGLGFEFYTHFTSPIRRYADLIVHRLVKHFLFASNEPLPYSTEELSKIASHISNTERVAMEAEREFYKIKSLRFLKGMEGKRFNGIISGIIEPGLFVQIEKYGIEGMVRFSDIEDDYYIFDEVNYCAIGKRTRRKFTVGDRVKVEILSVKIEKGFLDLRLVEK